jgi:hypothetical protein
MSRPLGAVITQWCKNIKDRARPQSPINCVMHNGSRPVSAVKQSAGVKIATTGVSRPAW